MKKSVRLLPPRARKKRLREQPKMLLVHLCEGNVRWNTITAYYSLSMGAVENRK